MLRWILSKLKIETQTKANPQKHGVKPARKLTDREALAALPHSDPKTRLAIVRNFVVRDQAEWVLEKMRAFKDLRTLELLSLIIERSTWEYDRFEAVELLEHVDDADIVPLLLATLKDSSSFVRHKAAEILGRVGDPRAIEPLIALLEYPNMFTRHQAETALRQLGEPVSVEIRLTLAEARARRTHLETTTLMNGYGMVFSGRDKVDEALARLARVSREEIEWLTGEIERLEAD